MNIQINTLVGRIMAIITILVAVFMIAPIYTANSGIATAITSAVNTSKFLVLPTLLPFGPIIILLGLLFTGGLMAFKPVDMNIGIGYMIGTVIPIVGTIMILSIFPSIIHSFDGALTAIVAANDTIGELFIGTVLPLLIYLLVAVAPSITPAVAEYKSRKSKTKASPKTATAAAY
jgi:hypothetical protein